MQKLPTPVVLAAAVLAVGLAGLPQSARAEPGHGDGHAHADKAADNVQQVKLAAEQQKLVDALTTAYLSAQEKLAADSTDGLAADFERMHESAHDLAASVDGDLKAAADRLATAAHDAPETLDAAREAYKTVSAAATDLAKIAPPSDAAAKTLYAAHCPMAKAGWLQTTKELANPYMGKDMLRCGTVEATVKAE